MSQNINSNNNINNQYKYENIELKKYDTDNKALLGIEYDETEPKTQRRLFVGVHHNNSDRLTQNYLLKGTKAEILKYLKDNSNNKAS